jgi:Tfp pilus assembly protein PilF
MASSKSRRPPHREKIEPHGLIRMTKAPPPLVSTFSPLPVPNSPFPTTHYSLLTALCSLLSVLCLLSSCATATAAEEYYSIGMAYYEMGEKAANDTERNKAFENSARWLERAKSAKGTMRASEYNLGRIAFETKKYSIAVKHFEQILKADPDNVMALKSAAYTEIMLGNIDGAGKYYQKVLTLEPESTDDGFNYALVLYAMEKYEDAENVLKRFAYAMPDNKNTLLLLARAEKMRHKVEAVDDYALWLVNNIDPAVRFEYAEILAEHEFYVRAIEELKKTLEECKPENETETFKKITIQFRLARLILIADINNDEGVELLQAAFDGGYDDVESLLELSEDGRVTKVHQDQVRGIVDKAISKQQAATDETGETAAGSGEK